MKITDEDCEKLRRLYLEHEEVELTLDEAREMMSRLLLLFERFAAWVAKEKAAGREFPLDERPPEIEDSGLPR
jgi:hypothetical protein